MELTGTAKSRFSEQDLLRRGRQLIRESINHGVTAMRAFVEIDNVVGYKCLDAAAILKTEFMDRCHVQICAFAQLPLFTGPDNGLKNRELMEEAAGKGHVDVVGSTPYVEDSREKALNNLKWISKLAQTNKKHLDLHLDYTLDPTQEPLVHQAVEEGLLMEGQNTDEKPRKLTLGHCTRMSLFSDQDWQSLGAKLREKSTVSFVGLPTSDLFMMRTDSGVRGTLPVIKMIEELDINTAIAVNNVGNAFTPQGSCDPLSVASFGVAVYQAATKKNTETLFECVSSRAKAAIGLGMATLDFNVGEPADFVLFDNEGWRGRKSISEAVYDQNCNRQTIYNGRLLVYQDVGEDLDAQREI